MNNLAVSIDVCCALRCCGWCSACAMVLSSSDRPRPWSEPHGVELTATVTILPHIFTIRSTTPTVGVTYHWVPNLLGQLMCPCRDGSVTTVGMETKTPGLMTSFY